MLGQRQRIGDAALAFLVRVVDVLQTEMLAIGQQAQKITRVLAPGHHQDVANPRIHQRLDGVIDHRLVVDRQQVLVGDLGQRKQPASRTPRQYDALH